jgi:hypothetical protein
MGKVFGCAVVRFWVFMILNDTPSQKYLRQICLHPVSKQNVHDSLIRPRTTTNLTYNLTLALAIGFHRSKSNNQLCHIEPDTGV